MIVPYDLAALQSVDLEIDRLNRQRRSLPELGELRRLIETRKSVESDYGKLMEELRSLDLEFDRTNGELTIMDERLKVAEKKLFGGGMGSRETQNRRMEVQSLRTRIDGQESLVLELMERRENISVRTEKISADLDKMRRIEDNLGGEVRKVWQKIDGQLAKLLSERSILAAEVPSEVMKIYESLRKTKGGVAAGKMEGGTCGGCHLALSESERGEARESDPPRCPHCRRILVF